MQGVEAAVYVSIAGLKYCKECRGSLCEHGRRKKSQCKECRRQQSCEHGRERRK
jgi:hypothetical protein